MRYLVLLLLAGCASAPPAPFPQLSQMKGQPQAPVGNVVLQTDPQDAQVAIDGVVQGLGSDFDGVHGALRLKSGAHSLQVTKDGYQPYATTIFASDDGRQVLQISLDKL